MYYYYVLLLSILAELKDPGSGEVFSYNTIWDSFRIFGCKCDDGYTGVDCSLRECPVGDDPMTGNGAR
jgi:hypothetical protein